MRRKWGYQAILALAACSAFFHWAPACATPYTFNGSGNQDWLVAGRWSPSLPVPSFTTFPGDVFDIPNTLTAITVTNSTFGAQLNVNSGGTLNLTGSRTANQLHLVGGTLSVSATATLSGTALYADALTTSTINNTANSTFQISAPLNGSGVVNLQNNGASSQTQLTNTAINSRTFVNGTLEVQSTGVLNLVGTTADGSGGTSATFATPLHGGTVNVNSGGKFLVNASSGGFSNGTVNIKTGGVLEASSTVKRTLNVHLQGGNIQSTASGTFLGDQSTFSALTVDAASSFGGSQSANLYATLGGLANTSLNYNSTSQSLTLQQPTSAAATYRGNWDVQQGQLILSATVGSGESAYHLGGGKTINIASGSQLTFGDAAANNWNLQHTVTGSGTLARTGSTDTLTFVGGGFNPGSGASAGSFTVNAPLTLTNGATFTAHLNGATAGSQHDQVSVNTGAVNLTGSMLSAKLGYTPSGGDTLVLLNKISAGLITGTFSGYAEGATINLGTRTAVISYIGGNGNDVTLSGFTAPGAPNLYHWKGTADNTWNQAGNWTVDAAGVTPTGATPTTTSDVLLSITPATGNAPGLNVGTTLGQDFAMRGLTLSGNTSAGNTISIGGGNKLTVAAGGITAESGAPNGTISAGVDLSAPQCWTNNSNANSLTVSGDVNNGGNLLTVAGVGNVVLSGDLSGSGGLTSTNRATVTLSGDNTYGGTTTISNGAMRIEHASALGATGAGAATTVSSGAALHLAGNITTSAETLTLNGTGVNNDGALRSITGTNTFTGPITLTTTSRIQSESGTLNLDVASGNAITATTPSLLFGGSGNIVVHDPIVLSSGSFTKDGLGTLTLRRGNTTGTVNVLGGTMKLDFAAAGAPTNNILTSTSTLALTSSSLSIEGSGSTNNQTFASIGIGVGSSEVSMVSGAGGALNVDLGTIAHVDGGTVHFSFPLSGAVTGSGLAPTVRPWASTGTGTSTRFVAGSTLTPYMSGTAAANANIFTASGTNYEFSTTGSTSLTGNRAANTVRYSGSGSGAGYTIDLGSNTLTLNGLMNADTGNLTIQRSGSGTLVMGNTNELVINTASADVTVTVPIHNSGGSGNLYKTGANMLTLGATNTYTGDTYVNGGTLSINANDRLGPSVSGQTLNLSNGTLQATATFALDNNGANRRTINIAGNGGAIDVTSGNALTASGFITGTGSLTKTNSGTLVLGSANTYSGGTTITGGTLELGLTNALPVARGVTIGASGKLDLGNYDATIDALSGSGTVDQGYAGTATLTVGAADGNGAFSGALTNSSGKLNFTKVGLGAQSLSGAGTYTGATVVHGGILNIQHATALGAATGAAATGTTVHAGATLQIQSAAIGNEALTLNGAGAGGQNGALVGVSGTNSYAGLVTLVGDTTIAADAGSLTLANLGSITGSGFGLVLTGAGNGTIASSIATGAAPLTKNGGGTWTLTGTNSYSGPTNLTAGKLVVNGSHTLAGAYTVYSGATLGGSGIIDGDVTLRSGATIAPGNSPDEFITGNETWNGGANYLFEINDVDAGAGNHPGWDLLAVTGKLTISATAGDKFNVILRSLELDNDNGIVHDFVNSANYAWLMLDADDPIEGFTGSNQFDVMTASTFTNAFTGTFSVQLGTAVSGGNNTQLYLVYAAAEAAAVPEPSTLALGLCGLAGLIAMAVAARRANR